MHREEFWLVLLLELFVVKLFSQKEVIVKRILVLLFLNLMTVTNFWLHIVFLNPFGFSLSVFTFL